MVDLRELLKVLQQNRPLRYPAQMQQGQHQGQQPLRPGGRESLLLEEPYLPSVH